MYAYYDVKRLLVLWMCMTTQKKCNDANDSFHVKLERVYDQFGTSNMNILLEDNNAKIREKILYLTTGNESLHKAINFETSNRIYL
jgi:hypothetical protein